MIGAAVDASLRPCGLTASPGEADWSGDVLVAIAPLEALQRSDGDRRTRAILGGPKGSGAPVLVGSGCFRRVGYQVSSRCPFTFVLGLKFKASNERCL